MSPAWWRSSPPSAWAASSSSRSAGPLSDRLGRRLSGLIGCGLYAIFFLGITFAPNLYVGYVLAVISGMANSFLDTSITPSCMEIFKEKGTIANIFTKLSISIAQFLLPFAIGFVAARELPFRTIFLATAVIILVDGAFLAFLPFPPFEKVVKGQGKRERMRFTPAAIVLICLGFTTSTTFMLWMNCNQELGRLYGLADPARSSPSTRWASSWPSTSTSASKRERAAKAEPTT